MGVVTWKAKFVKLWRRSSKARSFSASSTPKRLAILYRRGLQVVGRPSELWGMGGGYPALSVLGKGSPP